jgi:galactose mutarotase-like enzyme
LQEDKKRTLASFLQVLDYDGKANPAYPHPFKLEMTAKLDGAAKLVQELKATNTGEKLADVLILLVS